MVRGAKLGRNSPCPCGSGQKYKWCCEGRIPWADILSSETHQYARFLSARGKNLLFLQMIGEVMGLDHLPKDASWGDIKRGCTPAKVRDLHIVITQIWPDIDDLARTLRQEQSKPSALYVGTYTPESILRGVTRHCIYSDTILLVDPFIDGRRVRDEYNPIAHPEQFITVTIRNIRLWLMLAPWIEAGLIKFIRPPGDFDPELALACMQIEEERYRSVPELRQLIEEAAQRQREDELDGHFDEFREYVALHWPNEEFIARYRDQHPNASPSDVQRLADELDRRRD